MKPVRRHSEEQRVLRQPWAAQLACCEATFVNQVCAGLIEIQEQAATNMADAMRQLKTGTYGYCIDCLSEIPAERLAALPVVVRCADCEREGVLTAAYAHPR